MQALALLHLRLRGVNMPVWRWPISRGKAQAGACLLHKALVEDLQVAVGVRRALTAAPAQLSGACIAASAPVDIKQECGGQADSARGSDARTRLFGHLLATLLFFARATSNVAAVLQRAAVPAGKAALCAPRAPGSWGHVVQLCSFAWLPSRMVHSVAKARAAPLLALVQMYQADKRNALCYTLQCRAAGARHLLS